MILASVFDLKAEFFSQPITARTDAEAVRMFGQAIKDKDSQFNAHPEDFAIYSLANFDQHTGLITPEKTPRLLIAGTSLI